MKVSLPGVRRSLKVTLICISLMDKAVTCFLKYLLTACVSPFEPPPPPPPSHPIIVLVPVLIDRDLEYLSFAVVYIF